MVWSIWDVGECGCEAEADCSQWESDNPSVPVVSLPIDDDFSSDTSGNYTANMFLGTLGSVSVASGQLRISVTPSSFAGLYRSQFEVYRYIHLPIAGMSTMTLRGRLGTLSHGGAINLSEYRLQYGEGVGGLFMNNSISWNLANRQTTSVPLGEAYFDPDANLSGRTQTDTYAAAEDSDILFEMIATNNGSNEYTSVMKMWHSGVLKSTLTFATAYEDTIRVVDHNTYGLAGCGHFVRMYFDVTSDASGSHLFYVDDLEVSWT